MALTGVSKGTAISALPVLAMNSRKAVRPAVNCCAVRSCGLQPSASRRLDVGYCPTLDLALGRIAHAAKHGDEEANKDGLENNFSARPWSAHNQRNQHHTEGNRHCNDEPYPKMLPHP